MYISNDKAKFGKVTVEPFRNTFRLRFSYLGKRYSLTVGQISKETFKVACAKAQEINSDILMERFDNTLAKYSPKHAHFLETAQEQPIKAPENLLTLWEKYKHISMERVAKTTQKETWSQTDRCLAKIPTYVLHLENSELLLKELLTSYSAGTLERTFDNINACCHWAIEAGLIEKNPYQKLKKRLPKPNKSNRTRECFSEKEIKTIIKAFKEDKFKHPDSNYSHSYYAPYVQFLAFTGCRPEEAIALTWDDIKERENGVFIRINKAFSKRELKTTKTHETRLFPCNEQLREFLNSLPKIPNLNNLIFPSVGGKYLDQHNFLNRQWHPIVMKLWQQGEISQYLPTYNLRHSFITRLIRLGLDPATIAALVGTSVAMINNHYLAANRDISLPDF